jgi:hypothetical protein
VQEKLPQLIARGTFYDDVDVTWLNVSVCLRSDQQVAKGSADQVGQPPCVTELPRDFDKGIFDRLWRLTTERLFEIQTKGIRQTG